MSEQDLLTLIGDLDAILKDRGMTSAQKDAAFNNVVTKLERNFTSDKGLESENLGTNIERVVTGFERTAQDLIAQDIIINRRNALASIAGTVVNPNIAKLRDASKKLTETKLRIIDAKQQDMDFSDYLDVKKEELEELKANRDSLKTVSDVAGKPLKDFAKNNVVKEYKKIDYSMEKFKEYNDLVKKLETEKAKPASEERDNNIASLEAKINAVKTIITSDKCVKFNETDKVQITVGGSSQTKTFKELLDANQDISIFITGAAGTIKDASNNVVSSLKDKKEDKLEELKNEINTNTDLSQIKGTLIAEGYDFSTDLTETKLTEAINIVKDVADTKRNEYLVAKNEYKAKKHTISEMKKDEKIINTTSNNEVWEKYVSDSDKNALIVQSNTWSGRMSYWRSQGSNVFGAFFKAFGKQRTLDTMKYTKVQSIRQEAKQRKENKTNSFRKTLVKLAAKGSGDKVRPVDKENAYTEMDIEK